VVLSQKQQFATKPQSHEVKSNRTQNFVPLWLRGKFFDDLVTLFLELFQEVKKNRAGTSTSERLVQILDSSRTLQEIYFFVKEGD
jgi:hypothetical protein